MPKAKQTQSVPAAKPHRGSTIRLDEKYTGPEPIWDTDLALNYTKEQFDNHLRKSFFYYNYHFNTGKLRKHLNDYLMRNSKLDKKLLSRFESIGDRYVSMTPCSLVMASKRGMPLLDEHAKYIDNQVLYSLDLANKNGDKGIAKVVEPEVISDRKITIQDRLQERTRELIGEIEGVYDEVLFNRPCKFNAYDFLTVNKVPQSQLGQYEAVFQKRVEELMLAQDKADDQLTAAYKHYKPAVYKRLFAFLADLLAGIEQYRGVKRAVKKARVRKAPSREKLVARLKYCRQDNETKVVSINPVDIIGSQELWVYNTKTRKLGKYVAEHLGQLGIKGTSVTGFDTTKSVAKTLRKPLDQLKEFNKAGKVALRTFLKDIKAVEIQLNGRIGTDVVLLKVQ